MADEEKKPVAKTKSSTGRLFWQSFIVEDFSIVKDYLIFDVLVPTIKDTIIEASCSAINLIFTGDTGRRGRSNGYLRNPYERDFNPYNNIYRTTQTGKFSKYEKEHKSYEEPSYFRSSRTAYLDLIFTDKGAAMDALDRLRDMFEEQDNVATIGDYYAIYEEVTGVKPEDLIPYGNWQQKNRFGWTDLSQVIVTGRRGEYYLTLPKAEPI